MKREKVTYEEVATACENLLERGDNPSVRNVLQEVGGGGSQTIATHLTAWRQNQAASEEAQQAITSQHISGDLVQSLLREIARHKDQAVEGIKRQLSTSEDDLNALRDELAKAHEEIDEKRQQADMMERELVAARQQMGMEAATQAALLGERQKQVAKLGHDLEAAVAALAQERVVVAQLRAAISTSQSRTDELLNAAKKTEETETQLRSEYKKMQQAVADMQYAVFEAEKSSAVAVEQVNSRDTALAKLEEALQVARQERRTVVEQHQVVAEKLEAAVRRADIAEARLHAGLRRETEIKEGSGAGESPGAN